MSKTKQRLEYLRGQLRGECISWDEIAELQSLAEHIEADDVELREPAGLPEFPEAESPGCDATAHSHARPEVHYTAADYLKEIQELNEDIDQTRAAAEALAEALRDMVQEFSGPFKVRADYSKMVARVAGQKALAQWEEAKK